MDNSILTAQCCTPCDLEKGGCVSHWQNVFHLTTGLIVTALRGKKDGKFKPELKATLHIEQKPNEFHVFEGCKHEIEVLRTDIEVRVQKEAKGKKLPARAKKRKR